MDTLRKSFSVIMHFSNDKTKNHNNISKIKLDILCAEDVMVHRKVIKHMLTSLGHTLTFACNGEEALEIFRPGKFDLILMDIRMPVMDGLTATQKLKEKYDDLPPIVGVSANAFEGDREKYIAMGMDEYIRKPVKRDDFIKCFESKCHIVA